MGIWSGIKFLGYVCILFVKSNFVSNSFFDRDNLPEAFIFMTLIKIGLSGLMMSLYLTKTHRSNMMNTILFSTMYALCSFAVGYFFNIMWQDAVYLLPLVLLGVEGLLQKKYKLLIISLSILFISNFYTAYMVGIFTFLYFSIRWLLVNRFNLKTFIKDFFVFMLCAALAAGISAFITLPTFFQLGSNDYQPFKWNTFFNIDIRFTELFAKFFNSSENLLFKPNVYTGILTLLLFPLFFLNKKIQLKEKFLYFFFMLFLIISLQVHGLNMIWHVFQEPSGFQQRFAFLVSFLLVFLACRALNTFDEGQLSNLIKVAITEIIILVLLPELVPDLLSLKAALFNIILIVIFTTILYAKVFVGYRKVVNIILIFFVLFDLSMNTYNHIKTLNSYTEYNYSRNQYNVQVTGYDDVINSLVKEDKGFYRVNSLIKLTLNDGLRFNYKGMDIFNTLANGELHDFMNKLGYSTTLGARSLAQSNGILTSDALLGFKYVVTSEPINIHGFKLIKSTGETKLYENQNYLPIGFMMEKSQVEFSNYDDNPFENQNKFLGGEASYFTEIKPVQVKYNNLVVTENGTVIHVKKGNPDQEASIEMIFNIQGDKQLYTLLNAGKGYPGYGETSIYVNGKSLGIYPTFHNDRVLDLGGFSNEEVAIKIEFSVAETNLVQHYFYTLDIPSFEKRISELKETAFNLKKYNDISLAGKIKTDKMGTLFFSIPYDEGWSAKIDGKETKITKLGGFIGLDNDKGEHNVTLSYLPKGFLIGCIISLTSLVISILLIVFRKNQVIIRKGYDL
ncbi:hypothetical protein B4065_1860 [Caldibacillus thermoamylovorans]|nr:hypothetical protein B4065_1860 [Caldibacillus thermoamylovorans]